MTIPHPPTLRILAEAIHHAGVHARGPHVVRVCDLPDREEVEIGLHALSVALPRPLDSLVGFRAPSWWSAVGVTSTGKLHHLDREEPSRPVAITSMVDRTEGCVSILDEPDGELLVIEDPPEGWSHDVLLRVLGLPTQPPHASSALLADVWWLDALAESVLAHPDRRRTWRTLARAHPLCPRSGVPEPEELAALTTSEALDRPWHVLRERMDGAMMPAVDHGPRGEGTVLSASHWFDDGSFARWVLRDLPAADALVDALLSVLPGELGDGLLRGLAEVEGDAAAA